MPLFGSRTQQRDVETDGKKAANVVPKRRKRRADNWYTRTTKKISNFDALALFEKKRPPPVPRTIYSGLPLPPTVWAPTSTGKKQLKDGAAPEAIERKTGKTPDKSWVYPSNQVLTSKYNIVTFIPKNLLEQFRRIANIFFLVLVILQFFPRFTNVSPALAALPLLVVLGVTALKDGYEDFKRHQSDKFINNLGCHVLAGPGVLNVNMTEKKTRALSFRWLTKMFGNKRNAKQAEKNSEALAADLESNGNRTVTSEDDDNEIISPKIQRNWWGTRKTKIKARAPDGDNEKINTGSNRRRRGLSLRASQPAMKAPALQSYLFDEGEDVDQRQGLNGLHSRQASAAQVPTQTSLSSSQTANGHGQPAAKHASVVIESEDSKRAAKIAHWKRERWEDVKVGDFIRLTDGDSIPADVIVCATSEEENVCYVETKNLDGETNLKVRQAISELTHIRSAKAAADAKFFINSEAPDVNMFKYNASVEIGDGRKAENGKALRASANLNTTLLRGCVLRNTEWVIGIVVFTGIDTKIVMNSGGTPSKRSRVERQMNPMVFLNLFLLALMCIMCAIGDWALESYYFDRNAYWEYGADRSDDNPRINGLVAFANAMITFQNIVPISLYISIEFVRTVQAFYIWADDDIKYEPTSRRTLARSWNLSDDLGQIEYVFSDKTGTLTQNSMQFRHCSIGGTVFKGDGEIPANTVVPASAGKEQAERQDLAENKEKAYRSGNGSTSSNDASSGEETRIHPVLDEGKKQTKLPAEVLAPFHDAAIDRALLNDNAEAERIRMFFTNLGLCHTVLASEDGEGHIEYKAQSPDEAALVQAAADVGFVFRGRDSNILHLQTPTSGDRLDKYELLNTLEFTSARKRMSVLLRKVTPPGDRKEQNPVILFAKGADNIIFERLAAGNNEALKKTTDGHLEEFASEGLRTLTLAWKHIPEDQYQEWAQQYHEATLRIDDREDEMERVAGLIENELTLLGATAIEDKLQDGVPEAIADLKRAGMKVWVATGDKLETAIAIGMSSNLLAKDMNLIVIRGGAYGEPRSAYSQMRSALINFFKAEDEIDNFDAQPPDYDQATGRPSLGDRRHSRRRSAQGYGLGRSQSRQSGVSGLEEFVGADNGRKPGGYGLVIDGGSLTHALAEDYSKEMLLFLATRCQAVICCRVSPLQKALIVRLVKDGLGVMCLAIGDGANDVSMIQAADVGVGVAGEEGLQAVNSSDYAIGQFRFLCKLLFVHGHWSYMRNSEMICNFFYKEIIGIGILFFFQFYCAFSTTTVYEYTYILFWNVFWTLVPVLAMGIFDRNLASDVIMAVPEVYRFGIRNAWFGLLRFSIYMLDGVYASAVIYFFLAYTYNTTTSRADGYGVYIYEFSTTMAVIAVITANLYNGFNTFSWNWFVLGGVLVGPVLILCYTAVYAAIKPGWIWTVVYGNNTFLWPSAYWWLGMFFCFILCMLPKYFMRYWNENYRANDIDILKYIHKQDSHHDFLHDPMIPAMQQKKKYADRPVSHPQAEVEDPDRPPMLAQRGRQMTDASGAMVPMSGRGFAFDEDPHPRPSTSSRPASLSNVDGINSRRRRARSIRLGPVTLDLPSLHSPGTLRRTPRKGRAGTIGTLSEQGESPTTPRTSGLRTATSYERPTTPTPAPASSLSRGSRLPENATEAGMERTPSTAANEPHLYVRED